MRPETAAGTQTTSFLIIHPVKPVQHPFSGRLRPERTEGVVFKLRCGVGGDARTQLVSPFAIGVSGQHLELRGCSHRFPCCQGRGRVARRVAQPLSPYFAESGVAAAPAPVADSRFALGCPCIPRRLRRAAAVLWSLATATVQLGLYLVAVSGAPGPA